MVIMKDQAIDNRRGISKIKGKLLSGEITYNEAKIIAQPIINKINKDIEVVSRRHNKKPYKLTFLGLMR